MTASLFELRHEALGVEGLMSTSMRLRGARTRRRYHRFGRGIAMM
jgi:hypothetical protein